jgi:hypothetical protein
VPGGGQGHGDEGPHQAANALPALLVTAPVAAPRAIVTPTAATKPALGTVAERQLALTAEPATLDAELDRLPARAAPALPGRR